jgi:hypothetical protein
MDELEFALETVGNTQFERFSAAFLRAEGYDVHESGASGADGGWDARIELGDRNGIAHASTSNRWKRKLRTDAEKVAELEAENEAEYDILAFLTTQQVSGQTELDMEAEIRDEHGWELKLFHRDVILGELRQSHRELSKEFFDIELGSNRNFIQEAQNIIEEQIEDISSHQGYAGFIDETPAIALHVVPHGMFSQSPVTATELPKPPVLSTNIAGIDEIRGKDRIRMREEPNGRRYGVFRNDGLYESADTAGFVTGKDGSMYLKGSVDRGGFGFDASIILATQQVSARLSEINFSGTASVWISLIDAADVKLTELNRQIGTMRHQTSKTLGQDRYTTEPIMFSIGSEAIISDISHALDELWREFGSSEGTKNVNDDEWVGGRIKVNGEILLEEGDR